ncbi:MAG: uracil-DNA glycosylase [Bacillota bacterium]
MQQRFDEAPAPMVLEDLAREAAGCRRCGLRAGCRGVVFGEGDPHAAIVLVGEGPGRTEDELGRPFVGAAGKLLDRILEAAGFSRASVYITNAVKCRPPANRIPFPEEVAACRPWLDRQFAAVKPRIVVCLGAAATQALLNAEARISRVRGQWFERDGRLYLPTFHPAALLRDSSKKRPVWEDFKALRARYLGE